MDTVSSQGDSPETRTIEESTVLAHIGWACVFCFAGGIFLMLALWSWNIIFMGNAAAIWAIAATTAFGCTAKQLVDAGRKIAQFGKPRQTQHDHPEGHPHAI